MTEDRKGVSRGKKPDTSDTSPVDTYSFTFENWRLKFDRFGWDVVGIILLAASLITLMGLTHLTQGGIITIWVNLLRRWLGWGSYLLAVALALVGYITLRKRTAKPLGFSIKKIIAAEIAAFLIIAFISVLGGHSLARAESGLDGGQIGWGLTELFSMILPLSWVGILAGTASLLLLLYAFGIFSWVFLQIETWVGRIENESEITVADLDRYRTGLHKNRKTTTEDQSSGTPSITVTENSDFYFTPDRRSEHLPPLSLLKNDQVSTFSEENVHETARRIEKTLEEFGIPARVVGYRVGPTVTQFAVEPGYVERQNQDGETERHKVRVSQISGLSRDLALALSAERLRIEAPVPGQSFVGIEVPNPKSSIVGLRSILESEEFHELSSPLGIALGKDVSGRAVVADLSRMPHLLIAGTTGSGKSVCIAALTLCLVMNNSPEQLKLVMIDPKMVELVRFNGLKHLLGKVETAPERIPIVLRWSLAEMDRRYRLLEAARARNIDTYNNKPGRKREELLPKIVILIDELADLMFSAPDQTEHSIVRLAQMARATGIHLVVATQRPSTDVVTGLIKANFPARISFNVASGIDSRVILDGTGAETLLGKGDMLFLNPERGKPIRAQGVIVTDEEIDRLIRFWDEYDEHVPAIPPWEQLVLEDQEEGPDRLVEEAIEIVRKTQRASASMLQRRLRIGYPRAARLIDELEDLGIVGPSQGGGRERDVLISEADDSDEDIDIMDNERDHEDLSGE